LFAVSGCLLKLFFSLLSAFNLSVIIPSAQALLEIHNTQVSYLTKLLMLSKKTVMDLTPLVLGHEIHDRNKAAIAPQSEK
jgi:hypothetical protein